MGPIIAAAGASCPTCPPGWTGIQGRTTCTSHPTAVKPAERASQPREPCNLRRTFRPPTRKCHTDEASVRSTLNPKSSEDCNAPRALLVQRSQRSADRLRRAAGATIALGGARLSSGTVEADSGLLGQVGDPFGPEHRRELAKHAWQAPGRHHRHPVGDHLGPGDLGAMDRHDRHHHRDARVGQDPAAWSASNDTARRMRARGSGHVTAAPDGSSWRRPEYCLESITNTQPRPIIRWSRLAQLPESARSCRTTHPYRPSG